MRAGEVGGGESQNVWRSPHPNIITHSTTTTTMARKRKNLSTNASSSKQNRNQKRARTSLDDVDGGDGGINFDKAGGYIDPSTGQRGAFPGLDYYGEDFYGPPADGMEYLRMVRSEAKGVPELLLAPHIHSSNKPPVSSSGVGGDGGGEDVVLDYDEPTEGEREEHCYFTESTYISLHPSLPRSAAPAFHAPILHLFRSLRQRLATTPPRGSATRPFPRWSDTRAWRSLLSSTPPKLGWVWSMQQWEVVRLLGDVASWMEWRTKVRNARGRGLPKLWGTWCWALLLKCQDVMVAEEVAVVRELGKVTVRMRGGMVSVDEEVDVHEQKEGREKEGQLIEPEEKKVDETKANEEAKKESEQEEGEEEGEVPEPKKATEEEGEVVEPKKPDVEFYSLVDSIGMLDMIISVVGDFFGQRDLLEERAAMGSR